MPTASEGAALDAMLALIGGSGDPMSRDRFQPGHFTVGAVTVRDDSIVMVHHRRLQRWLGPGGHVDRGDATLEAAAARELEEETGIRAGRVYDGIFDVDVHDIPASPYEPGHRHFNVSYRFDAATTTVRAAPEVVEARWVPLAEVSGLTTDPATLRLVDKLQRLSGDR